MNTNTFFKILMMICIIAGITACQEKTSFDTKIGIIVPLEHTAMNEIIAGFKETLETQYHQPVTIKIANAQNDMNLQRAIIQQMRDENFTMIVPIGTSTSQMSLSMIRTQPIVSLAAELSEKDRSIHTPCHLSIVHDEVAAKKIIAFIHAAYPNIKNITLIHSATDKIFPEIKSAEEAASAFDIKITPRMATSLPELTTIANSLPNGTEAILVLKDSLIVSGISILQKTATLKQIPLITSDEGSVNDGAGFALGVSEKEIGIQGAKLALAILKGTKACELPIVEMENLTVFVNVNALQQEGQNPTHIKVIANHFHYKVIGA